VIDQIYDFWFNIKDLNPIDVDVKHLMKRWYQGGEEMDEECRVF